VPSGGDGRSWQTAFDDLQSALAVVQAGQEVWVAQGVYRPSVLATPTEPRSATFLLPHEVRIFGGFAGTEATFEQRAGLFDRTILSGDIGLPGEVSDNSFHVVRMVGAPQDHPTVLDGFTIRDGNGLLPGGPQRKGAGVHVTANSQWGPWLELGNCIVRENRAESGGGIAALNLSTLHLRDCVIRDNEASLYGGGLYAVTPWTVRAYNSSWLSNRARAEGGAVFLNSTGSDAIWFVSSVFYANQADLGGAAMLSANTYTAGRGAWLNCTVAYNHATSAGGGFHADQSTLAKAELVVHNSILWGNSISTGIAEQIFGAAQVSWSDVEGGWWGAANLDRDPLFMDPGSGNLRTRRGSPTHDSASNLQVPFDLLDLDRDGLVFEPVPLDRDGRARIGVDPLAPLFGQGWITFDGFVVDMGAFEF